MLLENSETIKRKNEENAKLVAENNECKPKATLYDILVANKQMNNMKSFALNYGMTSNGMNRLLHDYGIQYKTGEQWFLYSQYVGKGYVGSVPVPITHSDGSKGYKYHTKWTFEGFEFLYKFLKEKGILPLIEKDNGETH